MNPALVVTLAAAVVVVAALAAVLVSLTGRRRLQAQLDAARADVEALQARVSELAATAQPAAPSPASPAPEFVITSLPAGSEPRSDPAGTDLAVPAVPTVPAGQFASVALGESLVRVVSLGHGLRRALSAENRNRIRFEIRREVKRSRRQRRREVKEARRQVRTDLAPARDEDAA